MPLAEEHTDGREVPAPGFFWSHCVRYCRKSHRPRRPSVAELSPVVEEAFLERVLYFFTFYERDPKKEGKTRSFSLSSISKIVEGQ